MIDVRPPRVPAGRLHSLELTSRTPPSPWTMDCGREGNSVVRSVALALLCILALPAIRRARNSQSTEKSKPGSASSSPNRYFQSMRARTASAAWRSERLSRNWRMVTSVRRHGGNAGWPLAGKSVEKSSSSRKYPVRHAGSDRENPWERPCVQSEPSALEPARRD
jgi:hypothetical protein